MHLVREHLLDKQRQLAAHHFFIWLETTSDRDGVARALSQLAFWVSSFRDVLMINESRVLDPALHEIARRHRTEDTGHEFFRDLHRLGMMTLSAGELFARPRASIRLAVYRLMSEVFRAKTDVARITLLLALEAAGEVFFASTARWVDPQRTKYERRDDGALAAAAIDAIDLAPDIRLECIAVVDRAFDAFALMFDTLLANVAPPLLRSA